MDAMGILPHIACLNHIDNMIYSNIDTVIDRMDREGDANDMKLRLWPVVISVFVASGVLFGGWFAYHSVALENPLHDHMKNMEGIQAIESIAIERDAVRVKLALKDDARLRVIREQIVQSNPSLFQQRELVIDLNMTSSEALEQWWSQALFEVAEAMDTHQYGRIPTVLEERAHAVPHLKVHTEMDDQFVYVRLNDGEQAKFVMLPREPVRLGVWTNE